MLKRLISFLIVAVFAVSLLPVFAGAAELTNLALGKTTTVNYYVSSGSAAIEDPATSGVLTDGDKVQPSWRYSWYFDPKDNGQMVLDLGSKQTFNNLVVYISNNRNITGYKIEVSDDNATWSEVKTNDEIGSTSGITKTANIYMSSYMFEQVTAQYIRFSVTSQAGRVYVCEVEVYNDTRNFAFLKDVEVGRTSTACDYTKLTDGNTNSITTATTWEVEAGDYVIVDLGENKDFDCVNTYEFGDQAAQNYKIEVSSDKSDWETVKVDTDLICASGTTNYSNDDAKHFYGRHLFTKVNARYVKITIGAMFGSAEKAYLEEIEVYISSDMPGEAIYVPDMPAPVVSDGIPEGYTSENFHIYLCIGQSNMVGRGDFEKDDYVVVDNAFLLNAGANTKDTSDDKWETAQPYPYNGSVAYYGFNRYSSVNMGSNGTMNPAFPFARALTEVLPDNVGVGIICNAYGGTTIEQWSKGYVATETRPDPGLYGGLYEDAVQRTKDALKMGGVLKGILWLQGETCAARGDEYLELLNVLATNLRNDLGVQAKDVPFIAGQYVQTRPTNNATIARISQFIENSGYAHSVGTSVIDNVHYDGYSQRLMGIRYAERILNKTYKIKETEEDLYRYVYEKPKTLPDTFTNVNGSFSGNVTNDQPLVVKNHLGEDQEIVGEYLAVTSKFAAAPSGYTMKEYGFAISEDNINFQRKAKGQVKTDGTDNSSVYGMLFHTMKPSTTYYFKPYAVYNDANGDSWTIYGEDVTTYTSQEQITE